MSGNRNSDAPYFVQPPAPQQSRTTSYGQHQDNFLRTQPPMENTHVSVRAGGNSNQMQSQGQRAAPGQQDFSIYHGSMAPNVPGLAQYGNVVSRQAQSPSSAPNQPQQYLNHPQPKSYTMYSSPPSTHYGYDQQPQQASHAMNNQSIAGNGLMANSNGYGSTRHSLPQNTTTMSRFREYSDMSDYQVPIAGFQPTITNQHLSGGRMRAASAANTSDELEELGRRGKRTDAKARVPEDRSFMKGKAKCKKTKKKNQVEDVSTQDPPRAAAANAILSGAGTFDELPIATEGTSRSPVQLTAEENRSPATQAAHVAGDANTTHPKVDLAATGTTVRAHLDDPQFKELFGTIEEARAHAYRRFSMNITGDDWASVEANVVWYRKEFMRALTDVSYLGPPLLRSGKPLTSKEIKKWKSWQNDYAKLLKHIWRYWDSNMMNEIVQSRGWEFVQEGLDMHKIGPRHVKNADMDFKCAPRMQEAIQCLKNYSIVRFNVLKDPAEILKLISNPREYGKNKVNQFWNNTRRKAAGSDEKGRSTDYESALYHAFYNQEEINAFKADAKAAGRPMRGIKEDGVDDDSDDESGVDGDDDEDDSANNLGTLKGNANVLQHASQAEEPRDETEELRDEMVTGPDEIAETSVATNLPTSTGQKRKRSITPEHSNGGADGDLDENMTRLRAYKRQLRTDKHTQVTGKLGHTKTTSSRTPTRATGTVNYRESSFSTDSEAVEQSVVKPSTGKSDEGGALMGRAIARHEQPEATVLFAGSDDVNAALAAAVAGPTTSGDESGSNAAPIPASTPMALDPEVQDRSPPTLGVFDQALAPSGRDGNETDDYTNPSADALDNDTHITAGVGMDAEVPTFGGGAGTGVGGSFNDFDDIINDDYGGEADELLGIFESSNEYYGTIYSSY